MSSPVAEEDLCHSRMLRGKCTYKFSREPLHLNINAITMWGGIIVFLAQKVGGRAGGARFSQVVVASLITQTKSAHDTYMHFDCV